MVWDDTDNHQDEEDEYEEDEYEEEEDYPGELYDAWDPIFDLPRLNRVVVLPSFSALPDKKKGKVDIIFDIKNLDISGGK